MASFSEAPPGDPKVGEKIFKTKCAQCQYYIDVYNALLDLIENPEHHGIHVVEKGCCGTGVIEVAILCNPTSPICKNASDHVFWDSYHPTEAAYKALISSLLQKYLSSFF